MSKSQELQGENYLEHGDKTKNVHWFHLQPTLVILYLLFHPKFNLL